MFCACSVWLDLEFDKFGVFDFMLCFGIWIWVTVFALGWLGFSGIWFWWVCF